MIKIIFRANLSNDYFNNRQDRYFIIEDCNDLCNFYCDLVKKVSEFSFELRSDGETNYSNKIKSHPYKTSIDKFVKETSKKIHNFFKTETDKRFELYAKGKTIY